MHSNLIGEDSAVGNISSDKQPGYAWIVMSLLWGMDQMNVIVFMSIGVLLPIWKEEMEITSLQAGLLGSVGFLGFALMALPASIWLTRFSPRLVTLSCALGMGVFAVIQGAASSVEVLLLSRFGFMVLAVSRIQMQVLFIQQWFQPRLYALANSLDFGNRSIGQMVAVTAVPFLVVLLGSWRAVYVAIAVGLVSLSILWVFFGREHQRSLRDGPPTLQIGSPAGVLRRHKSLWVLAGSQMGAAVAFGSFMTFFPTYAIDRLGLSITSVGLLMGLYPVGSILGSLASGPLSEKLGLRRPFIWIPGLLLPAAYIALLYVTAIPLVLALLLVAGICAMAVPPVLSTVPLDMRLAPREVAVALGLMRTLFPMSAALGPLLVGAVQQSTGSLFVGLIIVAPLPITLFIGGLLLPETGPKRR